MNVDEKKSFYEDFINYSHFLSLKFTEKEKIKENFNHTIDLKEKLYLSKLFILQMIIIFYLEKKLFFNDDNTFLLKFYRDNKHNYISFFDFIINFIGILNNNSDSMEFFTFSNNKGINYKIRCVDRSCILFNDSIILKTINNIHLDDKFIIKNDFGDNTADETLFNFLNRFNLCKFDLLDFILGNLTEYLILDNIVKKSSGSYYTPKDITDYLVSTSIEYYLLEKVNIRFNKKFVNLDEIIEFFDEDKSQEMILYFLITLLDIKILDPAVGSANILMKANKVIIEYYLQIYKIFQCMTDKRKIKFSEKLNNKEISNTFCIADINSFIYNIQNQIIFPSTLFGVDISKTAINIARLRQYLILVDNYNFEVKSLKKREIIYNFQDRLYLDDFLLSDNLNFCKKKYFDIIITNPPYLGESGSKEYFRQIAKILPEYYEGKMDLWYFFVQKSIDILKEKGYFSIISPNYWVTAKGAAKLRKRINSELSFVEYMNFGNNSVFMNAKGVHTNIFISKRSIKKNDSFIYVKFDNMYKPGTNLLEKVPLQTVFDINQENIYYDQWDEYYHFLSDEIQDIINIIISDSKKLKECSFETKQGIITGINKITSKNYFKNTKKSKSVESNSKFSYGDGIFILDKTNLRDKKIFDTFNKKSKSILKHFYKNSDVKRYFNSVKTNKFVLYVSKKKIKIENYPEIQKHLLKYKTLIDKSSINSPYLHRPRDESIFSGPKIITGLRCIKPKFSYNNHDWYAAQDIYFIRNKNNGEVAIKELKALLALFNSKLGHFWFMNMGKRKGEALEFFGEPIDFFPIKIALEDEKIIEILAMCADFLLVLNSGNLKTFNQNIEKEFVDKMIDNVIFELYLLNKTELINFLVTNLINKQINHDRWFNLSRKQLLNNKLLPDELQEYLRLEKNIKENIIENYRKIKEEEVFNQIISDIESSRIVKNLIFLLKN